MACTDSKLYRCLRILPSGHLDGLSNFGKDMCRHYPVNGSGYFRNPATARLPTHPGNVHHNRCMAPQASDETLYELVTRIMARYWPAHQSASTKVRRPVKLSEEITARTA